MTLEEYAQQLTTRQEPAELTERDVIPERNKMEHPGAGPSPQNPIAAAQRLINEHRLSQNIAEGCRLQILHDLEQRGNPYKMLLCAAEAIGRLDYQGDTFSLQVQQKIIDVYGQDILADPPELQ